MSAPVLPCAEIEPEVPARATVIWMHGLGADGHDFEQIVPMFGIAETAGVRFVFPHAPHIPITLNGGAVMRGWYDVTDLDLLRRADEAGVRASAEKVEALIRREHQRGVPSERIVLAGFSQGGAMALHTGLRHAERLAGILAISCYLVCGDSLAAERAPANSPTPIFMAHGENDPLVPIEWGAAARDAILALGNPVVWHTYAMPHAVCPAEILDIGRWLRERIGN